MQDPSKILSSKQPEADVYDNVSKQQDYADTSDKISINSLHESSQSGSDLQTDSSSHTVHKESSEALHSNIMLADSTQPNASASGTEENSSFQQVSPDSKAGGIKSHELQALCGQVQRESDGSDKEAQLGEDVSHIQPQSDLEVHMKDSINKEVQGGDPTNNPNGLLHNELSPQCVSASALNRSATESSKQGISELYYAH